MSTSILDFADGDPFAFYETLRASESPVWDEKAKAWLITRFDQCVFAERDETLFTNSYVNADDLLKRIKGGGANLTLSQGAEHNVLRRFHLKLLSPSSIENFRIRHIRPVVEAIFARIEGQGKAELCEELCAQIPPRVISRLLGMPYDDDALMARILTLNDQIVAYIVSGYRDTALRESALDASAELNAMLLPYIRERRERPTDDLISRIWVDAPAAGVELDEEAALGLCRELYFAGSDTTVHGIANALFLYLTKPDLAERVRADRTKALNALVEESLRLYNVVQFRHRICVEDISIGEANIKRGDMVLIVHAAANRDETKYACPAHADIDRRGPTDHVAFSKGTRSCVGSQLARVEMREALSYAIDRLPGLRLDPDAPPPSFRGLYMRSMGPLNVVFD